MAVPVLYMNKTGIQPDLYKPNNIFAISMEPLAARLRQHHAARGLGFTTRGLIISLSTDNITLYINNPVDNLHPVLWGDPQIQGAVRYTDQLGKIRPIPTN